MKTLKKLILTITIMTISVSFAETTKPQASKAQQQVNRVIQKIKELDTPNSNTYGALSVLSSGYRLKLAKTHGAKQVSSLKANGRSGMIDIDTAFKVLESKWNKMFKTKFEGISFELALDYFEKHFLQIEEPELNLEIPDVNATGPEINNDDPRHISNSHLNRTQKASASSNASSKETPRSESFWNLKNISN